MLGEIETSDNMGKSRTWLKFFLSLITISRISIPIGATCLCKIGKSGEMESLFTTLGP